MYLVLNALLHYLKYAIDYPIKALKTNPQYVLVHINFHLTLILYDFFVAIRYQSNAMYIFKFQSVYPLHFGDAEGNFVTQYYCNDYDDRMSLVYTIYQVSFCYKINNILHKL